MSQHRLKILEILEEWYVSKFFAPIQNSRFFQNNVLATTFLSAVFVVFLPAIFLILPVFLVFGAMRAYKELKKLRRKKSSCLGYMEKIVEKEEDSGIDASDDDDEKAKNQKKDEESDASENVEEPKNEELEDVEKDQRKDKESEAFENAEEPKNEASEDLEKNQNPFNVTFTFDRILPNVNFLKFCLESVDNTEKLASSLADYLISTAKSPVLVTFRDVATLEKHESTPENTARLQHKKRKIKVMSLTDSGTTVEQLTEILMEIFEKLEKSLTWIYIFDEHQTASEIVEDRKLVNEIRKMAAELTDLEEMMETRKEELIDFSTEVMIPKEEGVLWFNSKL